MGAGNGARNRWTGEYRLASLRHRSALNHVQSAWAGLLSTHEDIRTRLYEKYPREAEEHDREFIKKYDEDMNTTLIFVGFFHVPRRGCANLVSRPLCSPP